MQEIVLRVCNRLSMLLNGLFGERARGAPAILTYHRVMPPLRDCPPTMADVAPEQFCEHLEGLQRAGFRFVRLNEMIAAHQRHEELPPRTVAVTFDDGYHCVYRHALPILRQTGVPATVFLATSYLDRQTPFPFDPWADDYAQRSPSETWRPLSVDECREMLASGLIDFGAHTHTHVDFRGRPDEFLRDTQASVLYLERTFGITRPPYAFPWGKRRLGFANGELAEAARRAGVSCALSTDSGTIDFGRDPFEWGRFTACRWDTSASLRAKLGGWYAWGPRLLSAICGSMPRRAAPADCRDATKSASRKLVGS